MEQESILWDLQCKEKNMKIKLNGYQDFVLYIDKKYTKVGMKLSGGFDSSLVAYALSKYVIEERPDIKIIPITTNQIGKPYQVQFAKGVVKFLKKEFGDIFLKHKTNVSSEFNTYGSTQQELVDSLYKQKIIDCHLNGITKNPPIDAVPNPPILERSQNKILPYEHLYDYENQQHLAQSPINVQAVAFKGMSYQPLLNIDKKGVWQLYNYFGITQSLFPLTRTCEAITEDFSKHCGECWWCKERAWGTGGILD